jgi:hypothetical protein
MIKMINKSETIKATAEIAFSLCKKDIITKTQIIKIKNIFSRF